VAIVDCFLVTDTRTSEALKLAIGLLKGEFDLRTKASEKFPPEISHSHIRSSMYYKEI